MRVTDPTGNIPVIGFGQVDPGIITSPPTVTPSGSNTYTTDVVVTPTELGKRRVCVQTKNTENVNMDEVCYNIETSEKNSPGQGSPKFTEPTVSENSVVVCQPGQTCHIPLTYETSNNNCEKVTETSYITGVHIFQGSSSVGQTCAVDVGFTPTPDAGGTQHMCFKSGFYTNPCVGTQQMCFKPG
ncbi:uncharacterized protein LOC127699253 [Mytilus californianus]|uniref:uncharacterized protein LOC127699253 n=1 Tax=Mytilus californianus TaxID=6549 RepID=UPI002245174A|nr:uncharacterized protein LOC127699253 [Mytilus californianus]